MSASDAPRGPKRGTLYVVSTPIGNLADVTLRALDVLRAVNLVAAEDTRRTRKLLTAYGLRARLMSLHARSSAERTDALIERLLSGQDVVYVTDAGTPGVSDPGSLLVDSARRQGLDVQVVPGPSALTAALSISGLPVGDVRFLGFLPRGHGKRLAALRDAGTSGCAMVLYEAPSRVRQLLRELCDLLPDRQVALCRELTKVHEEVLRGAPSELIDSVGDEPRGEFTIVIGAGAAPSQRVVEADPPDALARARELRCQGMSTRRASQVLAAETGRSRKWAYQLIIDDEAGDGNT